MSYRQLIIAKSCHLSVKNENISVRHDEHINKIPFEDVGIIVIDDKQVTLSTSFLEGCSKNNIPILICGSNHMPAMVGYPINQHYRPFQVIQFQIDLTTSEKSVLAESLVKQKIKNQCKVVEIVNDDESAVVLLNSYFDSLNGFDDMNREGTAAKVFYNSLYGKDYVRFSDTVINSAQNYGYGVLRSAIARSLNTYGMCLYLGVKHHGATNPFNLVYDIIEPFRPVVDYYIAENMSLLIDILSIQVRKELVNLLNAKVEVNGMRVTVQYAIDLLAKSYLRAIEFKEYDLALPNIEPINFDKLNEPV